APAYQSEPRPGRRNRARKCANARKRTRCRSRQLRSENGHGFISGDAKIARKLVHGNRQREIGRQKSRGALDFRNRRGRGRGGNASSANTEEINRAMKVWGAQAASLQSAAGWRGNHRTGRGALCNSFSAACREEQASSLCSPIPLQPH